MTVVSNVKGLNYLREKERERDRSLKGVRGLHELEDRLVVTKRLLTS